MKLHCVGIGGIGISALARYYQAKGWGVSGSDIADSKLIQDLANLGMKVHVGTDASYLPEDTDKVVYSVAVGSDNPELIKAKELGIPTLTYAQALGEVSKEHFTLAVTGSHGKSTTTSLLALMMVEAGLDPTVIVGTQLAEFDGTNFRKGESKYLIIEADDYDKSFLNYQPQVTVVTNVDEEHLDTYKNMEGVVGGFHEYLKQLPDSSTAILNRQDPYTKEIEKDLKCKIVYFNNPEDEFDWPLQVFGDFNQLNAEAAWTVASQVGVSREKAEAAVSKYKGVWRRMEELIPQDESIEGVFYSDYGHHPTEVRATLDALKQKYPDKRLSIIFQPHQARRLTELFDKFTQAFGSADQVILLPVYKVAGREDAGGKTSSDLAAAMGDRVEEARDVEEALAKITGAVVVFMGAGDIDQQVRGRFDSKLLPR